MQGAGASGPRREQVISRWWGGGFLHRTAGHLLPSTWETLEKSPAGQLAPGHQALKGF